LPFLIEVRQDRLAALAHTFILATRRNPAGQGLRPRPKFFHKTGARQEPAESRLFPERGKLADQRR
jgi:hypothetical protein